MPLKDARHDLNKERSRVIRLTGTDVTPAPIPRQPRGVDFTGSAGVAIMWNRGLDVAHGRAFAKRPFAM